MNSGSAFVVTTNQLKSGLDQQAFLASPEDISTVELPPDVSGLAPVATENGFAVGGYRCDVDESLPEPTCESISGFVEFYDRQGNSIATQTTPNTVGTEALSIFPGPGDSVLVVGPEAWVVTPKASEPIDEPSIGPTCGTLDGGLYAAKIESTDPARPEDSIQGYEIVQQQEGRGWESVVDVPTASGGVYSPFCTSTGLLVADQHFDGQELVPLTSDSGAKLSDQEVVGVNPSGTVLTRPLPQPSDEAASPPDLLPAFIGVSRDGKTALVQNSASLEFVDV